MQALRQQTFADPVDLRIEDVPAPVPAAGEVLVRIQGNRGRSPIFRK
jgi:NADPH:quinone reductase-like Zn-dependent oxidoreductase